MMKGDTQAANQAEKEQIINVRQIHKTVMKSDRKIMQKEEADFESQAKLVNAGTVNNGECMDVDLAFDTNNREIHGKSINKTRTEKERRKDNKRKGKSKRLPPFLRK